METFRKVSFNGVEQSQSQTQIRASSTKKLRTANPIYDRLEAHGLDDHQTADCETRSTSSTVLMYTACFN